MFIGIDLGGTFTDGVLLQEQKVIKSKKIPTHQDISFSIENILQEIIEGINPAAIKQITLSTTLITNLIAANKLAHTGMFLFPGPGLNPHQLRFSCPFRILKGAIDYRGRIIEPPDWSEIEEALSFFQNQQIRHLVIAAKFSQRNPSLEDQVSKFLQEKDPNLKIIASHKVSGLLNWVRRANGAFYTLTVKDTYRSFYEKMSQTVKKLGLHCPLYILKADGGTIPFHLSQHYPLETIFSGPAASTLGALAGADKNITAVVIDIGGTTTDLALLLKGKPLLAAQGASLNNYPLPVHSLAISSLALGGDTTLIIDRQNLQFGPKQGPALCLGGPTLTITDVLVYGGYSNLSSRESITPQIVKMAKALQQTPTQFVAVVLTKFLNKIEQQLDLMFKSWEEEPAYRIWQVLSPQKERPRTLLCLGGPAQGIGKFWATQKKWHIIIPPHSTVTNAIGAALAKSTLKLDFFADTEEKIYTTNLGGLQGKLTEELGNIEIAKKFVHKLLKTETAKWPGQNEFLGEILYEEGFNIVRNGRKKGSIYQIGWQTTPGIRAFLQGGIPNV